MKTGTHASTGVSANDTLDKPPMSTGSLELKLGEKVPIAEKLRWIKIPQSSDHTNTVQWWPGVIYDSFMELIQDVGELLTCYSILLLCAIHSKR
jgi:hypothetical protein